jgi:ribosome maturation factor RimP
MRALPVFGCKTTADYGMGLAPIFCLWISRSFEECGQEARFSIFAVRDDRKGNETMRNEELTELLAPVIADLGLECLGVEYSPSHGNSLVRVYIDAADRPVTVDDCEVVSRQVSATLDVNDPIDGRYTLEVSSPGIDRPLFTAAQFARFVGHSAKLEVNLPINGRRRFQGPIRAVEGETISLEQDGVSVAIAHANVQKAKLVADLGPAPGKANKGRPAKKRK